MFGLSEINAMNRRAALAASKVEDNHNRRASFSDGANGSVILHSARFRDTVFLSGRQAQAFKARHVAAGAQGAEAQNAVIESYFN